MKKKILKDIGLISANKGAKMERFKLVASVHLLLIQNGKILLLRRYHTGYEDGNYSVVAGHIDGNESVIEAMQREALEEAGIKIKAKDLKIVHIMHRKSKDREQIDYFFTCDYYEGKIKIMEKDKCDELAFYDLDQLPNNTIPYIRKAIEFQQSKTPFSLYGW